MPTDIADVVWDLDDEIEDQPNVFIDPTLEAFCLVSRAPTAPPPRPDRIPLDLILEFLHREDDPRGIAVAPSRP